MAEPVSDDIYLPPLEPCLKGETVILSWRLVASALTDTSGHRLRSQAVTTFLTDPYVQSLFTKPDSAFDASADKSYHASFVKKTAAIQVSPTPNGKYDINTIKEDALWLSKVAKIHEVAALRVVLIEFQSRARNQLMGPLTTQDVANLQEAVGATSTQPSAIFSGFNLSAARDAADIQADFETLESRKRRIFQTYLTERRFYSATGDHIFTLMLQGSLPNSLATEVSSMVRNSFLQTFGMGPKQVQKSSTDKPTKTYHALASQCLSSLPDCIQRCQTTIDTAVDDKILWTNELQNEWIRAFLTEASHSMAVAFQLIDLSGDMFVSPSLAQLWFSLLNEFSFLDQLNQFPQEISDFAVPLQTLVCAISLATINLPRMMGLFEGEVDLDADAEYVASSSVLEHIYDAILAAVESGATYAVPVLFAWVPVVHKMFESYQDRAEKRDAIQNQKAVETYDSNTQMIPSAGRRNSAGSITTIDKRRYDDFLISKNLDRDISRVQTLAVASIDELGAYNIISEMASYLGRSEQACFPIALASRMRMTFMELLRSTFDYVGYQSEPVSAMLSVMAGGQEYWDLSEETNILLPGQDILVQALQDDDILEKYFMVALRRFPFEFAPFISFCRILYCSFHASESGSHEDISMILQKTPSLTFVLPDDFVDYQLANEEENANAFQFLDNFSLITPFVTRKKASSGEDQFTIPAETLGQFLVDSGKVALVNYQHSALALLGKRLEANLSANSFHLELGILNLDEVSEAISFLATAIRMDTLRNADNLGATEGGLSLLAEASRALPRNKDIVSIVCDLLDKLLDDTPDDSALGTVMTCLQFLHSILPICPGRVWSYMARCSLLSNGPDGGRISRLLGSLELSRSQFGVLISTVRLCSSLMDSAMSSSVRRKTTIKAKSRQQSSDDTWLGVSDKVIAQISLSTARMMVDVLENTSTWRFSSESDVTVLLRDLVPVMDNLILYTFCMDDASASKALTSPLQPAAKHIIDCFLAPSSSSLRMQPLIATLVTATQLPDLTLFPYKFQALRDRTTAVLNFCTTLVRISNYFDRPSTTVDGQLFKASPFVARVAAVNEHFREAAISLLEALVISAGKTVGEPPSLLGYLGPQTSRYFLQLLSTLDKPFNQASEVKTIWRFFSTIVRNRQQWMANCLLTGRTPREARSSDSTGPDASSGSILGAALSRLATISTLDDFETLSILDFITSAQNYWPWTIFTLQKDATFLSELRKFVRDLKPSSLVSKSNVSQACNEARIAAYIAEIFAMQLFHLRQLGNATGLASDLTQDLDYYLRDGVAVSGYNRSLHATFGKNFGKQYPTCTLDNFKRTLLQPRNLGEDFYYALKYADRILEFDPGWVGPRNNGFRSEMRKANDNLSLVDAQISLYHAWEFLLLELSNCLPNNDTLKKQSLQVAEQCLEANQESVNHDQVFERLAESRVNLALLLVQRVVDSAPSAGDVAQLLATLWATINSVEQPYATGSISLYRNLLKLLFVTLRAQLKAFGQSSQVGSTIGNKGISGSSAIVSQTVLSILDTVVARGFRSLVTLIHDSDNTILPADIAMLTAILQACLCIPGMDQSQTQILNIMAAHDAVHVAVSLYSWADKLTDQGDPVYGELALLFLLELSALPLVAEQLACDGILNYLTSANMSSFLKRPNVSPFADTVGPQRCYSIWAKAIVPLLLNILTALGPTIAPEVAYVLNQFQSLMKSSVERLEVSVGNRTVSASSVSNRTYVTLLSVSEIHSLSLMTRILNAIRINNARDVSGVDWDSTGAQEAVDFWLSSRQLLRERIVPLGPREIELKAMIVQEGPTKGQGNLLEEKVVEHLQGIRLVLSEEVE